MQRLFKEPAQSKDEFTKWCENYLAGMDAQIDGEFVVLCCTFSM